MKGKTCQGLMKTFWSLSISQKGFFLAFAQEAKFIARKGKMKTWDVPEYHVLSEQTQGKEL